MKEPSAEFLGEFIMKCCAPISFRLWAVPHLTQDARVKAGVRTGAKYPERKRQMTAVSPRADEQTLARICDS